MRVVVNGRFLMRPVTGVERYASEILSRLRRGAQVVVPGSWESGARGHLWEQGVLPRRLGGGLLWSPCNTGPLAVRRQVVSIHDMSFFDEAGGFSRSFALWYQWLIPRLARNVRHILTVSRFSLRRLVEFCGVDPAKVTVTPNGVDPRFRVVDADEVADARLRLGLPRRYVLSVGSIEPRKNLSRLLEAWRRLPHRSWDASLVLAGASNRSFKHAGLLADDPSIVMTGYLSDADLPAVYSGAEAFVFPSLYEGFGLPVLEAMACGAPVVCSNTTSLPEVAGDAALLVDPSDSEAIGQGIRSLLEDGDLRATLRRRGLERVSRFTWEQTAAQTRRVLEQAGGSFEEP